jgi:hypothetical protein
VRYLPAFAAILLVCACMEPGPVCEPPNIPYAGGCCPDLGGDGKCDPAGQPEPQTTTSTSQAAAPAESEETTTTQAPPTPNDTITEAQEPVPKAPACSVNADCGPPLVSAPFCDGNTVKVGVETPSCRMPATAASRCEFRRTTRTEFTCKAYCFRGACYPTTCYDGVKDHDEEDVDCGIACPPCDQVRAKRCANDSDCGADETKPGFLCYNGAVTRDVMRHACVNNVCRNFTEKTVVEQCAGNTSCRDGRGGCVPGGGTCTDCVMNQNELGVDCGGFCSRCAPLADSYPAPHTEVDMRGFNESATLGDWGFRFEEPILRGTCIIGAKLTVRRPNNYPAEVTVTRSKNSALDGRAIGFIGADTASARIWVLDRSA